MGRSVSNYTLLFLLALIWGSSFILMKKGLEVYSFIELANLRIFIAFISLIPFIPKAIKSVRKKHYFPILITAVLGNLIPAFLRSFVIISAGAEGLSPKRLIVIL